MLGIIAYAEFARMVRNAPEDVDVTSIIDASEYSRHAVCLPNLFFKGVLR